MATPLIEAAMNGKQTEVERLIGEGAFRRHLLFGSSLFFLFCRFLLFAPLADPVGSFSHGFAGVDLNARTPGGMRAARPRAAA